MQRPGGLVEPGLNRVCLFVWGGHCGYGKSMPSAGGGARDGLGRREGGSNHQTGPLDPRLEGRPRFALYGSRASLAAARPGGSSTQPRWCRPNPQGGCPGLGKPRAPHVVPRVGRQLRVLLLKKKRRGTTNGTPPGSSAFFLTLWPQASPYARPRAAAEGEGSQATH